MSIHSRNKTTEMSKIKADLLFVTTQTQAQMNSFHHSWSIQSFTLQKQAQLLCLRSYLLLFLTRSRLLFKVHQKFSQSCRPRQNVS